MQNVIVLGASGFIGGRIYATLGKRYNVIGTRHSTDNEELDIVDVTDQLALKEYLTTNPADIIINATGEKDVGFCEKNCKSALMINTHPVISLSEIITGINPDCKLIHISTDYVFPGTNGPYRDTSTPAPTTVYGITKYLAELALAQSGCNYTIIRTGAVMGKGGTFFDWIINELMNEDTIRLYDNTFFTPTPLQFLADMTEYVVRRQDMFNRVTLNVSGGERMTRYTFGLLLRDMIPGAKAQILPDPLTDNRIPHDLSLVPSTPNKNKRFIEYLTDEVNNAIHTKLF